ncbi:hypothetical protein PQX77_021216 [Marasmius sp. AFHP31]|nr:hypothetical protein PQX77_021216 [Marasmius sp. AFHP31]
MPKAKKPKNRCRETTTSDLKTSTHEVFSQSKCRVYSSSITLQVPKVPTATVYSPTDLSNFSMPVSEDDMVDSGMDLDFITTMVSEAVKKPQKLAKEPGNIKVNLKNTAQAKRYLDSDAPLVTWQESHRDDYLDWFMCTEGRGRLFDGRCSRCTGPDAQFRCLGCDGLRVVCRTCIIRTHIDEPLHRIQVWRSDYFQPITLKELGLRYQTGHNANIRCPRPVISSQDFVVLDWTGLHSITLDFCGCELAIPQHLQLMERGWWPSSYKEPRSAATFNLLRNFHLTNLQCQTPPTDFLKVLEQMGDGHGVTKQPGRDAQWMLMLREYRHIKTAKRIGRSHDPSGIMGAAHGSDNWQQVPDDLKFLFTLFVSGDANFKQKARSRPNDRRDPALGPGWGSFVPNELYMSEVGKRTEQSEISHCAGFAAISSANTKNTKGLRATGIGSISCSRHDTFRPNGMGDLQIGERYSNMDFIALYNLIACGVLYVVFSYDIACQWMRNFYKRMREYPSYMQLPENLSMRFKVPKFHLPAHGLSCLAKFSFNYAEGVGKTDGEGVKRMWAWLNGCARSLSMMTAGARWDTMDDFTNFWNWRKTVALESTLLKKMVTAIPEAVVNAGAYAAFTDALKADYESEVSKWQEMVVQWEQGISEKCPYDVTEPDITIAKVKKDLAEEDHKREMAGGSASLSTASSVIIEGLDIEDSQQYLLAMVNSKNLTELKETSIQKKRTALLKRIRKYYSSLLQHMPAAQRLIDTEPPLSRATRPETLKLFLPSSLDPSYLRPAPSPSFPSETSGKIICPSELISLEDRLRFAQAHEALSRLRAQLRARTVAYKNSSRVVASQSMYLKVHSLQDQIEAKVKALSDTYRRARAALLVLRNQGDWCNILRELQPDDVRGISERLLRTAEKQQFIQDRERAGYSAADLDSLVGGNVPTVQVNPTLATGQTKNHLSWIWFTHRAVVDGRGDGVASISGGDGADFEEIQESTLFLVDLTIEIADFITEGLRSEWCKARARARRSREEMLLVEEEMRRSIAFCHTQSAWWKAQCGRRDGIPGWLQEGLTAYAKEHSEIELIRAANWERAWEPIRGHVRTILQELSDPKNSGDIRENFPELEVEIELEEENEGCVRKATAVAPQVTQSSLFCCVHYGLTKWLS